MITRRATFGLPFALAAAPALADTGAPPPICMVMNSGDATISVIDMTTKQIIATQPAFREPSHWALTPDRQTLYVTDAGGNAFFAFDPLTGAPKGHLPIADPYQLGYSPDNKYLVVNALRLNHVDVYDAASLTLVKRFKAGKMPSHLDFSPDSRWCFSSQQESDTLFSFDMTTMEPRWTVPIGDTPAGVLWLNGKLIVCIMGENGIVEVDPVDGHITRRQKTGPGAHNVFLDSQNQILYVSNRAVGRTSLAALDPVTLEVKRIYPIDGGPDDIGIAPDGKIWIALRFNEEVAVMDPLTGDYETIQVGRSPHGIYLSTILSHPGRITAETV
ncbi:YncE family protein [Acidocella sp.]|jgi:DNA-binding beta-propeller fold protein YncE|uniref:YncE family protein n=1 Tax=Acidocella sp. TaxID=50710 RepID=UPI002605EAAF|nr:YncE family protein [Acidocella sp.]